MFCDFEVTQIEPGRWRHACRRCGAVHVKPAPRYVKPCGMGPPEPPPVLKRLANFTRAAIAHVLGGCPTCSDQQIAARHAICRACELYRADPLEPAVGICTHASCGCTLLDGRAYLNKLAWADQSCPLGKWPALGK